MGLLLVSYPSQPRAIAISPALVLLRSSRSYPLSASSLFTNHTSLPHPYIYIYTYLTDSHTSTESPTLNPHLSHVLTTAQLLQTWRCFMCKSSSAPSYRSLGSCCSSVVLQTRCTYRMDGHHVGHRRLHGRGKSFQRCHQLDLAYSHNLSALALPYRTTIVHLWCKHLSPPQLVLHTTHPNLILLSMIQVKSQISF